MSKKRKTALDYAKDAAAAHCNLGVWETVVGLLESGALARGYGERPTANRVIATAKREQQRYLRMYDKAMERVRALSEGGAL